MFRKKSFWNSLVVKLSLSIVLILLPLIVMHIINNYYSVEVIRNQVVQSNKNMLNLHLNQIDNSLRGVQNYVYQLSENDDLSYYHSDHKIEYNEYLKAKLRLYNTISTQSHFYTTIDSIFIYSLPYQDMIYTHFGSTYNERLDVTNELQRKLKNEPDEFITNQWNIWEGEEEHYLVYIIKLEDAYVGTWVNMEQLVTPFKFIDFGDTGRALITTADFVPITERQFIQEMGINLNPEENDLSKNNYSITGDDDRYIAIHETSSISDFNIFALIPEHTILEKLPLLQRISSVITVMAVLFLLIFIILMRRIFLKPIQHIVQAMRRLQKGNLHVRLPQKKSSTEFEVMDESFNRMISEIENLKVNVYERKINLQYAELKHLQLQINPHFFLNSLNIIYNLATVKEYGLIQEMSKLLANHFRFMFKSHSYFVTFEDEITHTKNYLEIQQLRFPDAFSYDIDISENLLKYQIPPLVIQTLVENSIKHAFKIGDPIEIKIKVFRDQEDPRYAHIHIKDTGDGFPDDVLQALQKNDSLMTDDGKRIGIWNVKRRLELLYGENQSSIEFLNGSETGAIVKIKIPIS